MTLKVGDRVRLKDPDGYIEPYRKWGHEGRIAVVERLEADGRPIKIVFEAKRKPKRPSDYSMLVRERDVVLVDDAEAAE